MQRRESIRVGEYYHIYNRGVEKRKIFQQKSDFRHFLESLVFFNTAKSSWAINRQSLEDRPRVEEQLVHIIAYCLNPNHFHILLKENKENGVSTFMKKICTGHAMYFNKKNERSGVLFQGRFKSVHISTNDILLYVSAYVNGNSQVHGIEDARQYPWCSFSEYMGQAGIGCHKEVILDQFKDKKSYRDFCLEKVVGMREKKELLHLLEDGPRVVE